MSLKYNVGFAIGVVDACEYNEHPEETTPLTVDDYQTIEWNVIKYLKSKCEYVVDEGHSDDELIGSAGFNSWLTLASIMAVIDGEPLSSSSGTLPIDALEGVSEDKDAIVYLDFFSPLEWDEDKEKYIDIMEA